MSAKSFLSCNHTSDSDRAACEGQLTLAEATEALRRANRNKSPGADGLSVEFFHFCDSLGEVLVAVFNESLASLSAFGLLGNLKPAGAVAISGI